MALPQSFLDQLLARTTMSALIGRSLKLTKAGREWKACCPFHGEKTPSFTVNDDKGFYHCFGCGAHGDAMRWLTDHDGLPFIEAVRELAAAAGLEVPARSADDEAREARAATVREALDLAQEIYARQLAEAGGPMEYLAGRGIGPAEIEAFGIGYARGGAGSLAGQGLTGRLLREAGLVVEREDGALRELFWDRITVPIHDARGRLCGFGARVWPGRRNQQPKFVNSPDGPMFDKGRLLFNLHRAAPLSRPQAENRLVVVEGYFDVIAMARAGFGACVAPMGTALTREQIERCWRLHHRPVMLFDGDRAGRTAALRACTTALPLLGPGREIAVAMLPEGLDPDDLLRELGEEAGRREIEAAVAEARGCHDFLFEELAGQIDDAPEARAGAWAQLEAMAGQIGDEETRAQYLGAWRARFDRELSAATPLAVAEPLHAVRWTADGDYAFPETESESERQLFMIVRTVLKRRAERRAITEEITDALKMAEAMGFVKKEINAVVREIESDLSHGPAVREEAEMVRVLYRRTLGILGPMTEAMLPRVADARARPASAQIKRRATINALIDGR